MNSWLKFLADGQPPLQWRYVSSPHNWKRTPSVTNRSPPERRGMRFHVVCLSFHHIRLGGILVFPHNQVEFQMLKSTLIAKCLHKNNMISDVPTGEAAVESIFGEYFPGHSYKKWNTQISDEVVNHFLNAARGAGTIRVDSFIKDLWSL
ncbi:hypothetical protein [Klebsiella pneumoniae]|uniref:hypothetical protein n=2 Tax=Enterobacterales TaxID=91347 RepID=UPI003B012E3D